MTRRRPVALFAPGALHGLRLYLLALTIFAMGTSEFTLAGLLPSIASSLDVFISTAGLLTSAFAAGMIIDAPDGYAGAVLTIVLGVPGRSTGRPRIIAGFPARVVDPSATGLRSELAELARPPTGRSLCWC